MHSVSAFFTAYSARLDGAPVEAVALVVSEGPGTEPVLRFVVVAEDGHASVVDADDVDLYGVIEDAREFEKRDAAEAAAGEVTPD